MVCALCNGPDHPQPGGAGAHRLMNCQVFVSTTQPLKDMIRAVYDRNPQQVGRGDDLLQWIYDNIYGDNPAQIAPRWVFHMNGDPRGRVEERMYLSVFAPHLLTVWNALMPYLKDQTHDVVQAKHCSVEAAAARLDTIVIYLRNKASLWRMEDELRRLRREGSLIDGYFKPQVPPGTGRLADLPGASTARQPDGDGSYGQELSALIGEAFDSFCRPMRPPTWFDFAGRSLAMMKARGINLAKPWNRPLQVF
jgi:hypothetical protein